MIDDDTPLKSLMQAEIVQLILSIYGTEREIYHSICLNLWKIVYHLQKRTRREM